MSIGIRGPRPLVAWVVMVLLVLASLDAQARTSVSATRLGIHPDGVTRFVMDVSGQFDFTVTAHADPLRLVINTSGIAWMTDVALSRPAGSVSRLRYEENRDGGRIVLMLDEPALVKSAFVLAPRDGLGWRFVMDIQKTTRAAFLAEAKAAAKPAKAAPVSQPAPVSQSAPAPEPASLQREPASLQREPIVLRSPAAPSAPVSPAPGPVAPVQAVAPKPAPGPKTAADSPAPAAKGGNVLTAAMPPPPERPAPMAVPAVATAPQPQPEAPSVIKAAAPVPVPQPEPKSKPAVPAGKPVVVIDPGHGGVDPGAIGVSGVYEKYITLAVARELKDLLEKSGRYTVHLTRDRDIFIRLRDRISIARQHNADLFISLHADAVKSPQIRGLSVYTLSQTASDSEAQALAEKENKADLIAGLDLSHESMDVANILIDLTQRETMNRSAGFAGEVVQHVGREAPLLGNTHRFAGFAVLKAPDVPSVLIELGYLSHADEERQLRQPAYRAKLAKAISRAVDGYFLEGQKAWRP